jgi:hypothetical protein
LEGPPQIDDAPQIYNAPEIPPQITTVPELSQNKMATTTGINIEVGVVQGWNSENRGDIHKELNSLGSRKLSQK